MSHESTGYYDFYGNEIDVGGMVKLHDSCLVSRTDEVGFYVLGKTLDGRRVESHMMSCIYDKMKSAYVNVVGCRKDGRVLVRVMYYEVLIHPIFLVRDDICVGRSELEIKELLL